MDDVKVTVVIPGPIAELILKLCELGGKKKPEMLTDLMIVGTMVFADESYRQKFETFMERVQKGRFPLPGVN